MDQQQALAELTALAAVPGALKLITADVRDELRDYAQLHVLPTDGPEVLAKWRTVYARDSAKRESVLAAARSGDDRAFRLRVERLPALPEVDTKRPSSYVLLPVTGLEGPDDKGRYQATTDDGSFCVGYPVDLLARLTEWRREPGA